MTELVTGIEGAITAEGDNLAVHAKAAAEMLFSATDRDTAEEDGPAISTTRPSSGGSSRQSRTSGSPAPANR